MDTKAENIIKAILRIHLQQQRILNFEKQSLINQMKKITGGKGFTIIVKKNG